MPHLPCKRPYFGVLGHSNTFSHLKGKTAFPEEEIVLWKDVRKAFDAKGQNVYSKFPGR